MAAKYPALLAALADFGALLGGIPNTNYTLNTAITAVQATPFSLIINETPSSTLPASGWLTVENEIFHYSSFVAGTKTFTVDVRNDQDTTAAAHAAGVAVRAGLTKKTINQIVDEIVAIETQLGKQFMKRQTSIAAAATTAVDFDSGDWAPITMGVNITTLNLNNPVAGRVYILELIQDATGGRTVTWPATVKWPGGTAPTLSGANKKDVIILPFNGTDYLAQSALNY